MANNRLEYSIFKEENGLSKKILKIQKQKSHIKEPQKCVGKTKKQAEYQNHYISNIFSECFTFVNNISWFRTFWYIAANDIDFYLYILYFKMSDSRKWKPFTRCRGCLEIESNDKN